MKFLPSLRQREPRPQARPPPESGLNADYFNPDIPFVPTQPSPPPAHARRGHNPDRHRTRPPSPGFGGHPYPYPLPYPYDEDLEHAAAPRIVRGHRKPPTRYAKETSAPIYFAPDPPTPGSYPPPSPARHMHDQVRAHDRPHDQDRRAGRSRRLREHRSPEYGETQPRDYLHPEEPRDHRHRSSRREPQPPSPEHEYEYEYARRGSQSRHRHHHAEAPRQDWHEDARRASHCPREDRDRDRDTRRHPSRHREDRVHGQRAHRAHRPHRQHTVPPPAAALQRAVASEWWKNPAVQAGARTALNAGANALMRHRREEGPWLGSKGAKVAGAALGAALADGLGGDGKK